jgi:large subunit ribosomal protein L28
LDNLHRAAILAGLPDEERRVLARRGSSGVRPTVNDQSSIKEFATMAAVCDVCAKGPGFGKSVSHSHRRTNRRWNPNIQTVHAQVAPGNSKRMNVCTSCLKAGKVVRG